MPRRSSLARFQRALVLFLAAGALGWFAWHWPASPMLAFGGLAMIWVGLALVLGAEFLALSRVGRADPEIGRASCRERV